MDLPKALVTGSKWFAIPGVLALCLSASTLTFSAEGKNYVFAAVKAAPGLQCKLHAPGAPESDKIPVTADGDGYARFNAIKANGGAKHLALDCKDAAGKISSYAVDLASDETFAPHPLSLASEKGTVRPALKRNPKNYTQSQLLTMGYGLRPDPDKDPTAYARWLEAASKNGKRLETVRPDRHPRTVTSSSAPWWVGSVLTGAPKYVATEAVWNVPTAINSGDQTSTTEVSIWNGLGGFGTGSGLIQGGLSLYTIPSAAVYSTWREYCCGDSDSNSRYGQSYGGAFSPNPGDQIFSQAWYCNAKGNSDIAGGYGCTFLEDENSGAILDCTQANGSPCWSVKATSGMTLGKAAEFIIENQSHQVSKISTAFTDFTPKVTMAGGALTTNNTSQTISSDPSVSLLTDFTKTTTHIVVALGSSDETYFSIEPTQPSYALYCHGPLSTSNDPTPKTKYKWASKSAGAAPPGAGECAWADRGPRPGEMKSGDTNEIAGYLNQLANLPPGKFAEVGVYRDPNNDNDNDMIVTQIVGFVNPPFSPKPTLP